MRLIQLDIALAPSSAPYNAVFRKQNSPHVYWDMQQLRRIVAGSVVQLPKLHKSVSCGFGATARSVGRVNPSGYVYQYFFESGSRLIWKQNLQCYLAIRPQGPKVWCSPM